MSETTAQDPSVLVEQGRSLHRQGRIEEAERLYTQALAADEFCAEAHQLLAVIAGQRGNFDQAIAGFRHTIALEGPTPDRLFNLAEACRAAGNVQAAIEAYNQALALDASYLDAYRNCAAMLKEAAERAQAGGQAETAQQLRRLAAHYLLGLGHAQLRASSAGLAEKAYREAATLDPQNAEAQNCLGSIALEAARPVEAETLYRRAHEIEPRSALFLNNLGRSLLGQVRLNDAVSAFQEAIEIDPTFDDARVNLEERTLLSLHYRSDLAPSAVFAAHRNWGAKEIERVPPHLRKPSYGNASREPDRPLRIAYVGMVVGSPLTTRLIEPLLANHELRSFTPLIYASYVTDATEFSRFKARFPSLQGVTLYRGQEIAKWMRERRIDIVVDLAGHLPHHRLDILAYKPAPIAVTWLGYPDTTGLPTVDYRITDEVADPRGAEEFHVERVYRLRQGSLVYRPPENAPEVGALPARTSGAVTFGNFDDPRKISPETIKAWGAIIRAARGSRILLIAREFADAGFAARLRSDFEAANLGPERLELRVPTGERNGVLGAYQAVDIVLDTVPYNGDPTAICEALWMGLPVVTLSGDRSCGRTSASILSQIGLERLDSHTSEEYIETAVEFAQDLDRIATLRSSMRERMRVSPLMDERGFARRFEAALRDMWRQWCKSAG